MWNTVKYLRGDHTPKFFFLFQDFFIIQKQSKCLKVSQGLRNFKVFLEQVGTLVMGHNDRRNCEHCLNLLLEEYLVTLMPKLLGYKHIYLSMTLYYSS